ncbi:MAG: glycoside hydrolase family 16 protein [Planctomycetota bacterium]
MLPLFILLCLPWLTPTAHAQSITLNAALTTVELGTSVTVRTSYQSPVPGIVMVQLFNSDWDVVASRWTNVPAGNRNRNLSVSIPANLPAGDGYLWQAVLSNRQWASQAQDFAYGVTLVGANEIDLPNAPASVSAGSTVSVTADFEVSTPGIVSIQLFDNNWQRIDSDWKNVSAGSGTSTLDITIPTGTTPANNYIWQAVLFDRNWVKKDEDIVYSVTVNGANSGGGGGEPFRPAGYNTIDWQDEFNGSGEPANWYPLLGYDPGEYNSKDEKGIRWAGGTENTAWMYSTSYDNLMPDGNPTYWLDGNGHLVLRAVSDKTDVANNGTASAGPKVKCAYLLSGRPTGWQQLDVNYSSEFPQGPNDPDRVTRGVWEGKLVSPANGPIYMTARVKANQIYGYSTWFAFWAFTETQGYEDAKPHYSFDTGTEIDIIEIFYGSKWYLENAFSANNHWRQSGGSDGKRVDGASNSDDPFLWADVRDDQWHDYGVLWTTNRLTFYVDGQEFYTTTQSVPANPVDMMMLLTMEYKVDQWEGNIGDGRTQGPFVSNNSSMREMSRVLVDHVRIYKQ